MYLLSALFIFLSLNYYITIGKEDSDINQKIIKEHFKLPLNIPISKSCVNLLKNLLEKNPMLRIELNSPLIQEWLKDNTKLNYTRKKKIINLTQFEEYNPNFIEECSKPSNTEEAEKKDGNGKLKVIVTKESDNQSDGLLNSIEKLSINQMPEEEILKEPARFEPLTNDDSSSSFHIKKASNSNSNDINSSIQKLKAVVNGIKLSTRDNKKSATNIETNFKGTGNIIKQQIHSSSNNLKLTNKIQDKYFLKSISPKKNFK